MYDIRFVRADGRNGLHLGIAASYDRLTGNINIHWNTWKINKNRWRKARNPQFISFILVHETIHGAIDGCLDPWDKYVDIDSDYFEHWPFRHGIDRTGRYVYKPKVKY